MACMWVVAVVVVAAVVVYSTLLKNKHTINTIYANVKEHRGTVGF